MFVQIFTLSKCSTVEFIKFDTIQPLKSLLQQTYPLILVLLILKWDIDYNSFTIPAEFILLNLNQTLALFKTISFADLQINPDNFNPYAVNIKVAQLILISHQIQINAPLTTLKLRQVYK
ncbi:Hypothetical_protein [Hexamita inflata]|uniref:Hypothetical_protein n=1 Tax=Hexamita inflata TaxID=28002 RepID=A0AA86RVI0_9EUKA|nr:Hypothetical protein HINF_LOCUS66279 [Hexamita inflata]